MFVEPLSIGIYAKNLVGNMQGKKIGILGVGPIGMSVLLACQDVNLSTLFVTDKINERLHFAKKLGADWIGNPNNINVVEEILTKKTIECYKSL